MIKGFSVTSVGHVNVLLVENCQKRIFFSGAARVISAHIII